HKNRPGPYLGPGRFVLVQVHHLLQVGSLSHLPDVPAVVDAELEGVPLTGEHRASGDDGGEAQVVLERLADAVGGCHAPSCPTLSRCCRTAISSRTSSTYNAGSTYWRRCRSASP